MGKAVISRWARLAQWLGLGWLAGAAVAAAADVALTAGPRDAQAMFGGHVIAFALLILAPWAAGLVGLLGLGAGVEAYRRPGTRVGWRPLAVGLAGVAGGSGLLIWSFVQ